MPFGRRYRLSPHDLIIHRPLYLINSSNNNHNNRSVTTQNERYEHIVCLKAHLRSRKAAPQTSSTYCLASYHCSSFHGMIIMRRWTRDVTFIKAFSFEIWNALKHVAAFQAAKYNAYFQMHFALIRKYVLKMKLQHNQTVTLFSWKWKGNIESLLN